MATYNPLTSVVLTANTTTVTISNIPQDYTDLRVVMTPASGSGTNGIRMRINGDSGSNYSITYMSGNGSLSRTTRENDAVNMSLNGYFGINTSTSFTQLYQIDLLSYTNPVAFKSALVRIGGGNDATEYNQGTWRSTAAISSLSFNINTFGSSTGDFIAGSRFDIYGIKAGTPKAVGGDIVTTDGTYWYHAFKSTGKLQIQSQSTLSADVLVVAGGGGGGSNNGAGGGAGGLVGFTSQSLISGTTYLAIIGSGGAGSPGNSPRGYNGNNSQFGVATAAVGGGGGGSYFDLTGGSGGSGGGGGANAEGQGVNSRGLGGSPTAGQGYAGGTGQANGNPNHAGAGGGGAGGVGADGSGNGSGGIGATYTTSVGGSAGPFSFINAMGSATGTGQLSGGNYYYAGGGGAAKSNTAGGSGGLGGGGNGGGSTLQSAGTANTGGGGGGQPNQGTGSNNVAKPGGSGIIIVRYAV